MSDEIPTFCFDLIVVKVVVNNVGMMHAVVKDGRCKTFFGINDGRCNLELDFNEEVSLAIGALLALDARTI